MSLLLLLGGASSPAATSPFVGTHVYLYDPSGGGTATEITGDVYAVSVGRGRDRELDEINAGTARIQVRNTTGNFGPFAWSGDYGQIDLGRDIIVTHGESTGTGVIADTVGIPVFYGFVEDIDYAWAPKRYTDATLICADGLARLGRQNFTEDLVISYDDSSGGRMSLIFAQVQIDTSWWAGSAVESGLSNVQADTIEAGTNVLGECQLLNRTEQGRLFMSRTNRLIFNGRDTVGSPAAVVCTFSDSATGLVLGSVPFGMAEVTYGSELLYTSVAVTREGGTIQTADDPTAAGTYKNRTLSFTGLLFSSDSQSNDMAEYLLARYMTATPFVSGVTVPMKRLSTANRDLIAGIELGDQVTLTWTPYGQAAVNENLIVEGISYENSIGDTPRMTFQLAQAPTNNFFILDSATDGVLDTSALGF